jgi:hypothetical protein
VRVHTGPRAGRRQVRVDELDRQAVALTVDEQELVPVWHLVIDDRPRKRREHVALDCALQRPGAEIEGEAALEEELERRRVPLDRPLAVAETAAVEALAQLLLQHLAHRVARQRPEHDHTIDPVEELLAEGAPDRALDRRRAEVPAVIGEADGGAGRNLAPQVRGHDDDRVAEIGRPPAAIRQAPVIEDLQEQVPDGGVRLLELVEQEHREGLHPDLVHQRHLRRVGLRLANDPSDRIRVRQFAHVEPDQPRRVAEDERREGLGHLGLPGAGWPDEEEHAEWTARIRDAGPDHGQPLDQAVNRFRLPDDLLLEVPAQRRQIQSLAVVEQLDGQAGHCRQRGNQFVLCQRRRGGTARIRRPAPQGAVEQAEQVARRCRLGPVLTRQVPRLVEERVGNRRGVASGPLLGEP